MIVHMMGVERMGGTRTMRWLTAAASVAAAGLVLAAVPARAQVPPRADYQAIAHPVVGRIGQTVEVELGVRNGGPGPAGGPAGGPGSGVYEVTPPEGTTITATPPPTGGGRQPCVAKAVPARDAAGYLCAIGENFPAGDRETLSFRVRIDRKVEGAEGRVHIVERDGAHTPDPDPANDSAPIRVEVVDPAPAPPADPDTTGTLLLATTSGTAISAGAIALGVTRRRQR
ncbi:hypothetical protein [Streptomyces sp. ISL-11]|uniref:hypothetical protein n=1 Tax=Streptomyces sp. ISL-11 TaxID=2819174 RepID=UPI001BE536B3|nr:hypothetical protein [Streptomyces sp. ISL-11]MBT2382708.1 hypothetical protein [Streptomyces sp. ISL-11]